MRRSTLLWILALLITLAAAVWQRMTGPTYPVRFSADFYGAHVSGKLLRTHETSGDLPVVVRMSGGAAASGLTGAVLWRRLRTDEPWRRVDLASVAGELRAQIPAQPAAGKVEYRLELRSASPDGEQGQYVLVVPPGEAAVARFKGRVPKPILYTHILCMFLGMLWSTRAGLEALAPGSQLPRLSLVTLLLLGLGGLMLGPVIQKFSFDAYWTGWPVGEDLTDNKLALAVLFWLIAAVRCRSGRAGRGWVAAAALVTLVIFSIPHSLHGSTLDYRTMEQVSG